MESAHDDASVLGQLARIRLSPDFVNSPGCSRFLSHIVETALQARHKDLTEYAIGVDLFGKSDAFDPRLDSIVRVYATKVRKKLRSYYNAEGTCHSVKIVLPPGTYVPVFSSLGDVLLSPPTQTVSQAHVDRPLVGVLPILLGHSSADDDFCARIADELINMLAGMEGFRILAGMYTLAASRHSDVTVAPTLGVNAIIEITASQGKELMTVLARLSNLRTGCVVWKSRISSPQTFPTEQAIAQTIAAAVGPELNFCSLEPEGVEGHSKVHAGPC